ncbi:MAG: hypothetical protein M5R40_28250 [Anaerolineae bacterium]|nr:hypothetical protein [Anaerolineae bacterium]
MVAVPVPSTDLPYPAPPALRVAETLQFSPELMARMPITASVAQHLDANAFADALVIHTNHLLDDVLLLNEVFVQLGAEMVFIPVMYGEKTLPAHVPYDLMYPRVENGEVVIYRNGEAVSKAPTNLDNGVQAAIVEAFRHYAMHTQRKILVLEDGGYHYEMLEYIKPLVSRRSPGIVAAVEQTRKGLRNAEAHLARANGNHHYPVLSVARSKLKTRFENQFIAQRVIEETTLMLYLLDEFLTYRDVLLLGYGVIGRPMAMIARNMGCRVFVRDTDLTVQRAALRDGFGVGSAVSPELFTGMPIVMGTTGVPSFTLPMFEQYLKSAAPRLYLVSASSGRIEFSHLIKFFEGTPQERLALTREFPLPGPDRGHLGRVRQQGLRVPLHLLRRAARGRPAGRGLSRQLLPARQPEPPGEDHRPDQRRDSGPGRVWPEARAPLAARRVPAGPRRTAPPYDQRGGHPAAVGRTQPHRRAQPRVERVVHVRAAPLRGAPLRQRQGQGQRRGQGAPARQAA